MNPKLTPVDVIYFESTEALRVWFLANHASADVLWVGFYKKVTGRPSITWSQAVDEALCVGWIDGILRSVDESRHVQRFTPRRKGSTWSAVNVAKVAALTGEGRMEAAGIAAFEARTPEKTAIYAYEQDAVAFSDAEVARFQANETAWADWERRPAGYRKTATHWVTSAKGPKTRERRLVTLIEDTGAGRTVKHLTPPAKR